jgi:general secretion pathway protein D
VTADKPTNSLIVTSSTRDYAELRQIIDELDRERRQVFIDAVIMEVSTRKTNEFGLAYHGAGNASLFGQASSLLFGGLNIASSIGGSTELQALALGVRGPDVPDTEGLLSSTGLSIPAFGVALNAIATSSDNDILSTPHIIALDNTTAEISVGENIPLQINSSSSDLSSLATLLGATATDGANTAGALSSLGNTSRQDVGTRIKITPHINEDNQVRLEIEEEISQQGATRGDLGVVSVVQRSASTTVVVDDEQTVVIGGLVHDAVHSQEEKVPSDYARASGLVEKVRQAFRGDRERQALELERQPSAPGRHEPSEPIDLPGDLAPSTKPAAPATQPTPAGKATPRTSS